MKVVVTGGGGALGSGVVPALIDAGYEAVVSVVDEAERSRYAGPARTRVVDLRDLDAVVAWAADEGPVDALVCLAGGFSMQPLSSFAASDLDTLLDLNVRTAANTLRAFSGTMPRGGSIVLIGARTWPGAAGVGLYAATKAAVVSLGKSASLELAPRGVRVNVLLPDIIDTPANRRAMPDADPDRWQKVEEIGAVIRFLCSKDAAIVNGNAIAIGR